MNACQSPVASETLAAYFSEGLPDDEQQALEEHLFGCDACEAAAARVAMLTAGLRKLVVGVVSSARAARLLAEGVHVRRDVVGEGRGKAHFTAGVDMILLVLRAQLAAAERVDVELADKAGNVWFAFEHVPFDRVGGEVVIACQRHYEQFGQPELAFRVIAWEGQQRATAAEYLVEHIFDPSL